jgi:hypothetical protein
MSTLFIVIGKARGTENTYRWGSQYDERLNVKTERSRLLVHTITHWVVLVDTVRLVPGLYEYLYDESLRDEAQGPTRLGQA